MARTRTSPQERQAQILAAMRAGSAVRIGELASRLGVSDETVRRDLDALSGRGLIQRTYGGGAPGLSLEPGLRERHVLFVEERRRMAAAAAALVRTGDAVMIDAGSSTLHLAAALAGLNRRIVAVTNGLPVAEALARGSEIKVVLCPGEFNAAQGAVVGPETLAFLRRLNADHAFIGASGLTPEGPTEAESGMAWVKRAMIERAGRATLLADHGKFDVRMLDVVCPLGDLAALVTDAAPKSALSAALRAAGVETVVARD